ncbi:MAG: hypothetical protein ACFFKA_19275 [Candidatus Thorarchaeota archaeon]
MSGKKPFKEEIAEKLLAADQETFELAKELFVNTKIKFHKAPLFGITLLNIEILSELNDTQLKYLHSLIHTEIEKREKKEKS